jgi:hypothetical protein
MSESKLPIVVFRVAADSPRIGWGYLLSLNGEPWLTAREADQYENDRLSKMLPLDRQLLEEQPMQPHDRKTFLYRAYLSETEDGYRTHLKEAWISWGSIAASRVVATQPQHSGGHPGGQ